jgi:hypothetical protein
MFPAPRDEDGREIRLEPLAKFGQRVQIQHPGFAQRDLRASQ